LLLATRGEEEKENRSNSKRGEEAKIFEGKVRGAFLLYGEYSRKLLREGGKGKGRAGGKKKASEKKKKPFQS